MDPAPATTGPTTASVTQPTTAQPATNAAASVYERLRRSILDLDLAPGRVLSERGLEADHGVSRTPLRAALLRLEADGLVVRENRSWTVAPIDLDEIAAVSELREAVETMAVRLACERASDADLAGARSALDAIHPDLDDSVRLGGDFHAGLARLSGNRLLVDAVEGAMTRLARTRWLETRTVASREAAWQEHSDILALVERRDAETAAAAVADHIRATSARLVGILATDRRALGARGVRLIGDDRTGASTSTGTGTGTSTGTSTGAAPSPDPHRTPVL